MADITRIGKFVTAGMQGAIDGITPETNATHNTDEVGIDVDPPSADFYSKIVLAAKTTGAATAGTWTLSVGAATFTINHTGAGSWVVVILELVSDGTTNTFGSVTSNNAVTPHRYLGFSHTPGTTFSVLLSTSAGDMDNASSKYAGAMGG